MRVKALLAALLMVAGLATVTSGPAHAATYASSYSELSLPARADMNNLVRLSGRIQPAATGRPVSLYANVGTDGSGGTWIAGATTDGNGRFSFVTTVTAATRYKFFSAKQEVGKHTYQNAATGPFVVQPPQKVVVPSAFSDLGPEWRISEANGDVTLNGRVWPALAGRTVSLYSGVNADGSGGSWAAGTTTNEGGWFTFRVRANGSTKYRFFSPKQENGNYVYDHTATGAYTVGTTFTSQFTSLSKPVWTSQDQTTTISGRIAPAAPGRPVSLYDAKTNTWLQGAQTNANGEFSFTRTVQSITDLKVFSAGFAYGGATHNHLTSDVFTVKSMHFEDNFDSYSTVADVLSRWDLRGTAYQAPTNEDARTQSRADASALGLGSNGPGNKTLQLKVVPDVSTPIEARKYLVGHVSPKKKLTLPHGHFEARVKFHTGEGAQSSLWHQAGYDASAGRQPHEFDVFESFGRQWGSAGDKTNGALKHTVYRNFTNAGASGHEDMTSKEGANHKTFAPSAEWWNNFHTIKGTWTPSGYWIEVGSMGVRRLVTVNDWRGTEVGDIILSILVTDVQARKLREIGYVNPGDARVADYTFDVDWIRVWR